MKPSAESRRSSTVSNCSPTSTSDWIRKSRGLQKTWLKAEIRRAATPSLVGNRPIGTSRIQANLGAEWDIPPLPNLTLTGNLTYTGRQFVDQANRLSIPGWTRLDLGMRYATVLAGRKTTFRASVQNAANRKAWAGVPSWGAVSAMIPRTFIVSATVDF